MINISTKYFLNFIGGPDQSSELVDTYALYLNSKVKNKVYHIGLEVISKT